MGVSPYRASYARAMSLGCRHLTLSVAYDNLIICILLQLSHLCLTSSVVPASRGRHDINIGCNSHGSITSQNGIVH